MPSTPFLPIRHPLVEAGPVPIMTLPWQEWARGLHTIITSLNAIPGVNIKTLAELNALGLGAGDVGYVAWETTFGHSLRWTGSVWQFAPGDPGAGWFALRPVAPQETGWQVCDGTVSSYLTVGAALLSVTPFTTPNVTAGTFLKVLGAYTGAIEAAIGADVTGSTADGTDTFTTAASLQTALIGYASGANIADFNTVTHVHTGTTNGHSHGAGSLATDTAARPPSLGGLLYFRR